MRETNYLSLLIPEFNDPADITQLDGNWELLDMELFDRWSKTAIKLGGNADLNDCVEIGMYTYSAGDSATISNVPIANEQATLLVYPRLQNNDSKNIIQFVITRESKIYVRNLADGVWNNWKRFISETEFTNHGRHIPDTCEITEDWNKATKTGWYMSNGDNKNAPSSSWYFGFVIAHASNYVFQEVYDFTKSSEKATNLTKYIRHCYNGTWTNWINVTVQRTVPEKAKLEYIENLKSDAQTQLNDLANNKMNIKPNFIEFATSEGTSNGGYFDFHFNGSTEDFTSRIIEEKEGQIGVIADILRITGILQIAGGYVGLYGDDNTANLVAKSDTVNDYKRSIQIMNENYEDEIGKSLIFIDKKSSGSKNYLLFGEHNKPTGSYVGSNTIRTTTTNPIYTGGVGKVLLIWCSNYVTIITPTGGFTMGTQDTGKDGAYFHDEVKYVNGYLIMNKVYNETAAPHRLGGINESGTTYYYQCL